MVSDSLAEAKELTSGWGWFLAAGIVWVIFGFVVLSFNMATVWAIAVFFGIGFIVGGVMEFAVAAVAPGWKWLYILIGIVSIVAGIMALVWPGQTFLVLAAIIGWLLLVYGLIDIVFAIGASRRRRPLVARAGWRDRGRADRPLGDFARRRDRGELARDRPAGVLGRRRRARYEASAISSSVSACDQPTRT